MPTLARFGAVTLRMYADDHRPPHFHVVGSDFEVLVRLSDLSIVAGSARPSQVRDALNWAGSNRLWLSTKWDELNERT